MQVLNFISTKIFFNFSELRLRRDKFLNYLQNASYDLQTVEKEFEEYLSILYGFLFEINEHDCVKNNDEKKLQSKLRYLEEFIWANSMLRTEALFVFFCKICIYNLFLEFRLIFGLKH